MAVGNYNLICTVSGTFPAYLGCDPTKVFNIGDTVNTIVIDPVTAVYPIPAGLMLQLAPIPVVPVSPVITPSVVPTIAQLSAQAGGMASQISTLTTQLTALTSQINSLNSPST